QAEDGIRGRNVTGVQTCALPILGCRMRHKHSLGVRSIDHLAYTSGMSGWNPAFKTVLAAGTLVLCLAADRPAVSLAVIAALAARSEERRGGNECGRGWAGGRSRE